MFWLFWPRSGPVDTTLPPRKKTKNPKKHEKLRKELIMLITSGQTWIPVSSPPRGLPPKRIIPTEVLRVRRHSESRHSHVAGGVGQCRTNAPPLVIMAKKAALTPPVIMAKKCLNATSGAPHPQPDSSRAFLKKRRKKDCTLWIYLSAGELPFFDTAHTGNRNSVVSAIFVFFWCFSAFLTGRPGFGASMCSIKIGERIVLDFAVFGRPALIYLSQKM